METPRFDRQVYMSTAVQRSILDCISELMLVKELDVIGGFFNLENMLFGLFDGYDYSDNIMASKEMEVIKESNDELYKNIKRICDKVKEYPKLTIC